jgi:hypothetical protein
MPTRLIFRVSEGSVYRARGWPKDCNTRGQAPLTLASPFAGRHFSIAGLIMQSSASSIAGTILMRTGPCLEILYV